MITNFIKPTYRLSRLQFFLYTLAYYVFVFVAGFVISATGGAGGWIALLFVPVLFVPYLQYIVRPRLRDMGHSQWWTLTLLVPLVIPVVGNLYIRLWPIQFLSPVIILCMMSVLLLLPGNQSAKQDMPNGIRKLVPIGAGLLAASIILVGGLVTAVTFLLAISTCFVSAWGCDDYGSRGALQAETETVQTAMNAMMADRNITAVSRNDDHIGSMGVNTWSGLPKGPQAAALDGYLKKATTHFYYCWDSQGNVYVQNKKDGVVATADDAEKQRPCKSSVSDPNAIIAESTPWFIPRLYNRVFHRNLLVITNSSVKPTGRLVTYGPDTAPFNDNGFIVIAAGEEAVRLPGPPVTATDQATMGDLFELDGPIIRERGPGFSVRVNSRLKYEINFSRYEGGLHLSRVEIKRQGQIIESLFTFLAKPGESIGHRVGITAEVDGRRLAATQPIGVTVRFDHPNVESLIEEYRLLPINRTNKPGTTSAGGACLDIAGYYGAGNDGGTFVRTIEQLPVGVGDYINVTGTTFYDGRWSVLQMFRYQGPKAQQPLWGYRILKKWQGFPTDDQPRVCTE